MMYKKVLPIISAVPVALAGLFVAPAAEAAPVACPSGYVCLVPSSGGPVQTVPEGSGRAFSPPLPISAIANATRLSYCVFGTVSFGIPAHTAVSRTDTVTGVEPGSICPG